MRNRTAGIFPTVNPGRGQGPEQMEWVEKDMQFKSVVANVDTANFTKAIRNRVTTTNFLLSMLVGLNLVTAISAGFLAYVVYQFIQAVQDAANQINSAGL